MSINKSVLILAAWCVVYSMAAQDDQSIMNTGLKMVRRIYDHCEKSEEIVKCLKIQAVKIADRAIKTQNITVFDGVSVIKRKDVADGRSMRYSDEEIKKMPTDQLDNLLAEKSAMFLDTHQMSLTLSSFVGKSMEGKQNLNKMIEEGRGKLKKYIGPILTAIAIKGGFVAMAFQAIAMIAGKALLIGKIALVLSAIIGLKKLVSSGEAHEKTTYEIVKHPQVSQSHTYSSSHYGGGGGGGEYETSGSGGGHYHRSLDADLMMQERAYSAHVPRS